MRSAPSPAPSALWPILCSFLLLLAGGSCSTFGPAFEQPGPEAVAIAEEEAEERAVDNAPVRKQHVSEEFPFIRFLLQTDGKHWTHYAFPCHDQAPELTRLLAQLTMQAAMDRPLDVCGGEGVR